MPDRSKDGKYRPFSRSELQAHVNGNKTLGHYMVDPTENTTRLFAFDIDLTKTANKWMTADSGKLNTWDGSRFVPGSPREHFSSDTIRPRLLDELLTIATALASRAKRMLDIPVAISFSGSKGVHVYGFTGRESARVVKAAGHEVIKSTEMFENSRGQHFYRHISPPEEGFPNVEIEVFPKQDDMQGKDFGNLMRLPLGIHRQTNQPSYFLKITDFRSLQEMHPLKALKGNPPWA